MTAPAGIITRHFATRRVDYSAPWSARVLRVVFYCARRSSRLLGRLEGYLYRAACRRAPVGWCARDMGGE